jgi:iron(III) transport system ATP-binding protein
MSDRIIDLRSISKSYGPETIAVQAVSLVVRQGTLLALLGPSGCGKTTTLRLIAGLEAPDEGEIWLNGQPVAGNGAWLPPEKRRVGLVFQDYALFPHLSVAANIAFPLNGVGKAEQQRRIAQLLELVGLPGLAERYPHQLSGGQQQRIALARALAARPTVVLLDEPFSNLDTALRQSMRQEVRRILRQAGATAIFVTHDQEEALSLADEVAVMMDGRLVQQDTPAQLYHRPVNRPVAAFLGQANFLPGQADGGQVTCALGRLPTLGRHTGPVEIMLRPEELELTANPTGPATVIEREYYGHDQLLTLRLDSGQLLYSRLLGLASDFTPGRRVDLVVRGPVLVYPATP